MEDSKYNELVENTVKLVKGLHEKRHPTQFLCDVITRIYGHKVKLNELIELIEFSPLNNIAP